MRLTATILFQSIVGVFVSTAAVSCPATGQTVGEEIEALVTAYHEAGRFDGSLLVAASGDVVFRGGFGSANRSWSTPNTADTRFPVGSLAKLFTALLTLQLVEQGTLALDAPVGEYLSHYDPEGHSSVTIRRLLGHTAGLPDYVTRKFLDEAQFVPTDRDTFVDRYCLVGPTGDGSATATYSSTHYCLLGETIAAVTGMPFGDALQRRVLAPLGLHDTGLHLHDSIVPALANGYVRTLSGYRNGPSAFPDLHAYGPGGMYSTVDDLFRLDRALYEAPGDVVAMRDSLYMRVAPSGFGPEHDFGLGATVGEVALGRNGESKTLHRAGGNTSQGHTAVMTRVLDDQHTVILLTNAGPGWFDETVHEITMQIMAILYDRDYDVPTVPIERELFAIIQREGTERLRHHVARLRDQGELSITLGGIYGLGTEFLRLERAAEALDIFQLLVEEYPSSSWSHNGLGEAYLANGERDHAIAQFRRALELDPDNPQAGGNLRRLVVRR